MCKRAILLQLGSTISPVAVKEPKHAKTIFKVVLTVVSDGRTRAKNLSCVTEYELHHTYRQLETSEEAGGLLGFATATDAVVKENHILTKRVSTKQPVAIAVVKAW